MVDRKDYGAGPVGEARYRSDLSLEEIDTINESINNFENDIKKMKAEVVSIKKTLNEIKGGMYGGTTV